MINELTPKHICFELLRLTWLEKLDAVASTEYCDRVCDSKGHTCREIGAINTWTQSKRDDGVFNEINEQRIKSCELDPLLFFVYGIA